MFFFELDQLSYLSQIYRQAYAEAQPFPHVVIDNFLPESVLEKVLDEFDCLTSRNWVKYYSPTENKLTFNQESLLGETTYLLLQQLNSSLFVDFLQILTGISGLIPDPHFLGAGLHQIKRGGYVKIHADFARHDRLRLDHRLNLLIYLNKDWKPEYGGQLEMWNRDMTECIQQVMPIFNRCLIFDTHSYSYHGHPEPLDCPEWLTRKSLAVYYYTNGRPEEEGNNWHSTLWQTRPGERIHTFNLLTRQLLKKLIPPALVDPKR